MINHDTSPENTPPVITLFWLTAESYDYDTSEEIMEKVREGVEILGREPSRLLYAGIDATDFSRAMSFGYRQDQQSWAMSDATTRRQIERLEASPIEYMKREGAEVPGLVVLDPEKLLVSHVEGVPEDARPATEEQLTDPDHGILYCYARPGESLDSATVAVFLFRQ